MPNFQQVIVCGHAGKDPEITYSKSGDMAIGKFSVAVTKKGYKGREDHTEWFNVTCFGATAEKYVGPYLRKGDVVLVSGELRSRKWEDKYYTDLIANDVQIVSSKNQDSKPRETQKDMFDGDKPATQKQGAGPHGLDFDDDIPF